MMKNTKTSDCLKGLKSVSKAILSVNPDKGSLDFAVLCDIFPDARKYEYLRFPESDVWGVSMSADAPLVKKELVSVDDLIRLPLFSLEQGWENDIGRWCGERMREFHLKGSFSLRITRRCL